jgi:hypothetical protein
MSIFLREVKRSYRYILPPYGRRAKIIASEENELWLSPISVWETLILAEKGRLELDSELQ